ncbi:hypothetical protein [uncultured Tenacibaculum sp.]|uniref:hypothetical protein n=1 Tax=uncultured Tenacibaculum sp. TaxID=174713 RepID=UPI00260B114E|nr:hypothetical protein [uncultured Tenacibaculum sp.]
MYKYLTEKEQIELLEKIDSKTTSNPSRRKLYYWYFGIEKTPFGVLTPRLTEEEIKELFS